MTAIVYRDGVLATDSAIAGADFRRGTIRKLGRSPRGTLAAAAGLAGNCARFLQWLENGQIDEWIDSKFESLLEVNDGENRFGAIIVMQAHNATKPRVICLDWKGRAIEHDAPFYVDGSAEVLLLGALAAGASAEEAIRIAIKYDIGCGEPVQLCYLNRPHLDKLYDPRIRSE